MSRTTGSTDINSKTFYGCKKVSTSMKKEQNINARLERWSSSGPIPETPQYGLLGPSLTWKVFPLQAEALSFALSNPDLMTFSFETKTLGSDGKRSFLVADPARFFDIFIQRPQSYRTSYEIIPEGSPSKLYFDLEFDKIQNVSSCGITMTRILIKIVIHFLKVEFDIDCTENEIISLDSSTDRKFSKHLIFNLKNCIFQNNFHVGHFVRNLCSNILSLINDPDKIIMNVSQNELRSLLVKEKGDRKLFIDLGVYTKNRNFRVYKATKLGKNNPLVLSKDDSSTNYSFISEKQLYLDSLITYSTGEKRLLKYDTQEVVNKKSYSCSNSDQRTDISKCGKSPYEEVDSFISEKIKPGFIGKWKFFPTSNHLIYSIENFRFCHNIGREHKSNGIYLVANIHKRVWYQKCHDPDCSGYQSPECPLPNRLFDWIEYSTDESILSELDECVTDFLNDDECFEEENSVRQPKEDTRNEMITDFLNDKECFEETIDNNTFCQPDSRNKEVSDFLNDDAWCTEVDEDVNNMETAHAKPKTDPTFDFMTNNDFEECNFTQMENVQLLEDASAFMSDDEFFKDANKIDERKTKDDWFADGLEDTNIESTQDIIRKNL